MARSKRRSSLPGILALLLLLVALLPLSSYLAGVFPGGGRAPDADRPAPVAGQMGTLSVTVVRSEDLSPVEGARIFVDGLSGGEADLVSDEEGKARIDGVGKEPVRVRAVVGQSETVAWADPRWERDVLMAVAPRADREGSVRDGAGAPVQATVRLVDEGGEPLAETETDDEGRYRLPAEPGAAAVVVLPADGAPGVAREGDVVVDGGERLEGRLLGAKEGALDVYALVPSSGEDALIPLRLRWEVSADGAFGGALPPGASAFGLYDGLPLRLKAGDLALPERIEARGRVTLDGAPVAGAIVFFRPILDGDFPAPVPGLRVVTDTDGRFEATGFARVRYAAELRAPGCASRRVSDVAPGDGPLELSLEKGFDVTGFVVDTAGLPVPGAELMAMSLPDPSNEIPVARATADPKGRFQIEGLGGGRARVRVTAKGYHPTTVEGADGTTELRIVLQRR